MRRGEEEGGERSIVPSGFEATTHPIFKGLKPRSAQRKRKRGGSGSGSDSVDESSEVGEAVVAKGTTEPGLLGSTENRPSFVCPICLDVLLLPVFPSSCFHLFCAHCLVAWLRLSDECPMCKVKIAALYYDVRSVTEYRLLDFGRGGVVGRAAAEASRSGEAGSHNDRASTPPVRLEDNDTFQYWLASEDPYSSGQGGRAQRSMRAGGMSPEGAGKAAAAAAAAAVPSTGAGQTLFAAPPRVISADLRAVAASKEAADAHVSSNASLSSSSSGELKLELRLVRAQAAMLRASLERSKSSTPTSRRPGLAAAVGRWQRKKES